VTSYTYTRNRFDHADLTTLDDAGITSEMTQLETAFTTIIGKIPTYMRPPSFATNADVLGVLGGLGYHVIQADIDTEDWQHETNDTIGLSGDIFEQGLAAGGTISLEHDVHPTTVDILVPRMISDIKAKGLSCKSKMHTCSFRLPFAAFRLGLSLCTAC
jgi:peptidoglycan/xylan/chitin deacetylase (PgdA/CDA1 family)